MSKSLFLIIVFGVTSFIFTDIHSLSLFYSAVLPLFTFIALLFFVVWFVTFLRLFKSYQITYSDISNSKKIDGYDGGE